MNAKKIWLVLFAAVFFQVNFISSEEDSRSSESEEAERKQAQKLEYYQHPKYLVVFTNGLDEDNHPISNVNELSFSDKKVCFYVIFFWVPKIPFDYDCLIYDGAGNKVAERRAFCSPKGRDFYCWTTHEFDRSAEIPGIWKFDLYVDDRLVIAESFSITDE